MNTLSPQALQAAIARSVERIHTLAPGHAPRLAIVLGSGWDGIADLVTAAVDIPYADLPAFPVLGVAGHAGSLRLGLIGNKPVVLLRGRKHAYETGDAAGMKGAIRTLGAIGCSTVLLTNAAGSLEPHMPPGSLMLICDHLNITQRTPLHDEPGASRFIDMGKAYDAPCATRRRPLRPKPASSCTRASTPGCWGRNSRPRPRSACCGCWARRPWA